MSDHIDINDEVMVGDHLHYTGWIDDPDAVRVAVADMGCPDIHDLPICEIPIAELPKEVNLYKFCQLATGKPLLEVRNQGQVGSCVGHGAARAVELTNIVEIGTGDEEEFRLLSRPIIYGGSRVNVNGGRSPFRSDGSVGAWAAKWCTKFGVIDMAKHGSWDLSVYSEAQCREFGSKGVPKELLDLADDHLVASTAIVTTADDAMKALANGHGISVCSTQGFSKRRDSNGVCAPQGSWAHCMAIVGYRHINGRLHFAIENSWGSSYMSGSAPEGYNAGTFLANADTVHRMLSMRDSFAFSGLSGWRKKMDELDWSF